jgi:hypothetical protein
MLVDLPWPDIAENCQKILMFNAVGPMSTTNRPQPVRASSSLPDPFQITNDHLSELDPQPTGRPNENRYSHVENPNRIDVELDVIAADQVQVIELSRGADIVFGPLKDLSHAGTDSQNSPGLSPSSNGSDSLKSSISSGPLRFASEASNTQSSSTLGEGIDRGGSPAAIAKTSGGELTRFRPLEIIYPGHGNLSTAGTYPQNAKEPIARTMQQAFARVTDWWNYGNVSTPVKVLLLVVVILTLVVNSTWLLPLAAGLGCIYLIYFFIHTWWIGEEVSTGKAPSQRELKKLFVEEVRSRLRARPISQKLFELVSSLIIAALACGVLCLLGLAIGGSAFHATKELWQAYGWMALTSVFACYSLLLVSKFWEDRPGETVMRRFAMVLVGVAVGGFSYLMANAFSLNLADGAQFGSIDSPNSKIIIKGMPMLPACMIYYAGLFGVLRWWLQADPMRSTRLSILSVSFCLIWASLFSVMLELPVVPNCILAGVISISIQLAAPWRSEKRIDTLKS